MHCEICPQSNERVRTQEAPDSQEVEPKHRNAPVDRNLHDTNVP